MTQKIRTTCNRDCPDSCGVVATVDQGRIIEHRGDPEHAVTQGFLCYRGNQYLKRFYSPDRIVHPQRKTAKGWEKISWDQALDWVAEKLAFYRDQHGPQSVAYLSYSGIKGQVARLMAKKFWAHFGGASILKGGTSVESSHAGQALDFGGPCTHAPDDLVNARGIVIWGKNVSVTRVHCWPPIMEARRRGAKLVVIDPVYSLTAQKADAHLQLRPGSDGWLAAAVARIILERGWVNREFVDPYTKGFVAFSEKALDISLTDAAAATDLTVDKIEGLASYYASTKPLTTMLGLGPSYWKKGGAITRLIDALAAMSGNVGVSGGGAHTDIDGSEGLDWSLYKDLPESEQRQLLLPKLGDELLAANDPPVKMGFVAGANPAATCPDTGRVLEGLKALDCLVVVDQFMTATAEQADLFLPCTTYLEMEDLVTAYGHHWLGLNQVVVPPLGESRPDSEIFQALAERLGFGEALAGSPRAWIERFLAPLADQGVTFDALAERPMLNPAARAIAFADRKFNTPSGKYEFTDDFSPCVPEPGNAHLRLMATKSIKMVNAQINDEDLVDGPVVRTHPETVSALGLADGEAVVVESPAGSVPARLAADDTVRRDVLLFNPSAWRGDLQGVNQLRESLTCDMGDAAAMHETWVTLRKA